MRVLFLRNPSIDGYTIIARDHHDARPAHPARCDGGPAVSSEYGNHNNIITCRYILGTVTFTVLRRTQ